MNKVKFVVVGVGHIGRRHAEMIRRNDEAELIAVVDIDKNQYDEHFFDQIPFFNSLEELLNSNLDFDVVNIATPNGFHSSQAILCLDHNKHVVIEKPIALTKNDAEKIIFKSLNVQKLVFGVMQNRYSPPSLWLKEVVNSKILGQIYIVQLNCFWNRDKRYYKKDSWHGSKTLDGGTLFTQFSHFIDIMFWLFGDIVNIQGKFANFNHHNLTDFEDSGFINFNFLDKNYGVGVLNYSTSVWEENLESSMTIIAEYGTIKIGGQYLDKVEYCNILNYEMPTLKPTNPGNDYGFYKGSAQNHNFVIDNVVNVLKSKEAINTNALEGLKVVEIIERIYTLKNK